MRASCRPMYSRLQTHASRLQPHVCQVRRAWQGEGVEVQTLTLTVNRGDKRLGMMLDDANVVLELKLNSPANGHLLPGDQVLALDHVELAGRRLAQVLQPRPTHIFKVRRHVKR